jgi:parallel beta-helix repeat protein
MTVEGVTITVDDSGGANFTTIQAAVDAAQPGDTIFVYNGTYHEDVLLNKSVTLTGEDRNTTIINGTGTKTVVDITSDWTNVTDFTITNSKEDFIYAGIRLNKVDNCRILNNNIWSNEAGIYFAGSAYNEIRNNNISSNNAYGLYLEEYQGMSSNNDIINNIISNNSDGIYMISPVTEESSNCNIIDNTISENSGGAIKLLRYG